MMDRITTTGFAAALALAIGITPLRAQSDPGTAQAPGDTVASAAGGAERTTAAGTAAGRYTLAEVNGKPLPAEVESGRSCRESVTAATLILETDGRWRLEERKKETCGDRTREDNDDDEDGTYRTEGGAIRFLDDDGDENDADDDREIDLDDLRTGTLAADGTLTVELADGRNRLLFRKDGR